MGLDDEVSAGAELVPVGVGYESVKAGDDASAASAYVAAVGRVDGKVRLVDK